MTPDGIVTLANLGATERAAIRNLTIALCDRGWKELTPDAVLAVTGYLIKHPDGVKAKALTAKVPANFFVRNKVTRDQFTQALMRMASTRGHL